jgi:hypothetical protein
MKETGWRIDEISTMLSEVINIETFEKKDTYGFLRMVDFIRSGRDKIKISLDFMEGEVRGRTEKQIVLLDKKFIKESKKTKISIAGKEIEIITPCYQDYLILKVVSGRPSDVRDIAALIWKNGVPKDIALRIEEILPYPKIFFENLNNVVGPTISDKRFVDSWRGTFISTLFNDKIRNEVLYKINEVLS